MDEDEDFPERDYKLHLEDEVMMRIMMSFLISQRSFREMRIMSGALRMKSWVQILAI